MTDNLENNRAQSIYIHIPFCKKKCNYCSFISFTNAEQYEEKYISALVNEISQNACGNSIKTIYLGGGTPNILKLKSVEKIINALAENFVLSSDVEITMEFNPKLSDSDYLKSVRKMGVNRISLGVQSFNDDILKTLNRLHSAQEALNTVENIKKAGFYNFSIDLMYGIFGQNFKMLEKDLKIIDLLEIPHISTYGLKIEKNTPFEKFDKTNLPNEDVCEEMYLLISEKLKNSGFEHYEISNFARKNFQSRHNLTYWRNKEYFGFGVGAHGYLNGIRYKKADNIQQYVLNPNFYTVVNKNTKEDIYEEYIFLGLRLKEGINLEKLKNEYDVDLYSIKKAELEKFIENGYMIFKNNNISLTTKGFLISNYILGELLG